MKIIGFRADPVAARYAIVNFDGTAYGLENANSESRLTYPDSFIKYVVAGS